MEINVTVMLVILVVIGWTLICAIIIRIKKRMAVIKIGLTENTGIIEKNIIVKKIMIFIAFLKKS